MRCVTDQVLNQVLATSGGVHLLSRCTWHRGRLTQHFEPGTQTLKIIEGCEKMQQAESKWSQDLPPLRTQERWPLAYPGRFVTWMDAVESGLASLQLAPGGWRQQHQLSAPSWNQWASKWLQNIVKHKQAHRSWPPNFIEVHQISNIWPLMGIYTFQNSSEALKCLRVVKTCTVGPDPRNIHFCSGALPRRFLRALCQTLPMPNHTEVWKRNSKPIHHWNPTESIHLCLHWGRESQECQHQEEHSCCNSNSGAPASKAGGSCGRHLSISATKSKKAQPLHCWEPMQKKCVKTTKRPQWLRIWHQDCKVAWR